MVNKRGTGILVALLLVALAIVFASSSVAQTLYRYKDDQGRTVIVDRLTPDIIPLGYEELDNFGRVQKVVPRAMTAEEQAAFQLEQTAIKAKQLAAIKTLERDRLLLRRYSTIEDIERAKVRATTEVQVRIDILKSNLESSIAQIASEQSNAADYERRAGKVPDEIVASIEQHQRDIEEARQLIAVRENELALLANKYQKDMDRFAELRSVVSARREREVSQ